jgi:hypothetical protein
MDANDNYAPDSDAPPRNEQEYLAQRVRELERAHRRWKRNILAVVAGALLLLLLTGGGFAFLTFLRARAQAMTALEAAVAARQAAEAARQQAEAAKQKGRSP